MGTLYDRADIYDLGFDERKWGIVSEHWKKLFHNREIHSVLDCSIGTGNLTLPLSEQGISLSGSDLSQAMLQKCREKAEKKQIKITLFSSDFRKIDQTAPQTYDCVMSTGNSLPYVTNDEVVQTLSKMDSLVKQGGYLYLDTRNWDKIHKDHQRFYFYPPVYLDDVRMDTIQVWDYNPDGSMTFHIVYSFEKEKKVYQREIFSETYHPIQRTLLLTALEDLGYTVVEQQNFPIQCTLPIEDFDWYCILAQKQ